MELCDWEPCGILSCRRGNGIVYVGSDDGNVYALNAGTGAKVWNYTTCAAVLSSPTVANRTVYVGGDDGNVFTPLMRGPG